MSSGAPSYELLSLPNGHADPTELRDLARAHPRARQAAHVSRSYRGPRALIAWHTAPVGADLERLAPTDRRFAASICAPAELERFGARLDEPAFVTSLWSSKEALAKALGDAMDYDPRRLESPLGWPDETAGGWQAMQLQPAGGYLAWIVWRTATQNSSASALSAASMRRAAGRR